MRDGSPRQRRGRLPRYARYHSFPGLPLRGSSAPLPGKASGSTGLPKLRIHRVRGAVRRRQPGARSVCNDGELPRIGVKAQRQIRFGFHWLTPLRSNMPPRSSDTLERRTMLLLGGGVVDLHDAAADDPLARALGHINPGHGIALFGDVTVTVISRRRAVVLARLNDARALLLVFVCSGECA